MSSSSRRAPIEVVRAVLKRDSVLSDRGDVA